MVNRDQSLEAFDNLGRLNIELLQLRDRLSDPAQPYGAGQVVEALAMVNEAAEYCREMIVRYTSGDAEIGPHLLDLVEETLLEADAVLAELRSGPAWGLSTEFH